MRNGPAKSQTRSKGPRVTGGRAGHGTERLDRCELVHLCVVVVISTEHGTVDGVQAPHLFPVGMPGATLNNNNHSIPTEDLDRPAARTPISDVAVIVAGVGSMAVRLALCLARRSGGDGSGIAALRASAGRAAAEFPNPSSSTKRGQSLGPSMVDADEI